MSRQFTNKDHSEKILLKLWKQCRSEEMCDVVLLSGTERKRIPAHRSILSVLSDYFNKLLNENSSKEVAMPSFHSDILQSLIKYCYTGCIVISEEIAIELLKTARILVLINLVIECENFLAETLEPSNCFKLALLANEYKCQTLLKKANDYCQKIYETDQFLSLRVEQVSHLLASDDLRVKSEEDVFYSLMKWIEHNQSEREKHKAELLKLVRMPLMERSFLTDHVKPKCTSMECCKIYMEALEWHLSPEINVFSEYKFTKPRGSDQRMMGITVGPLDNKIFIRYCCPQENKWMKWWRELEYRNNFGFAVMENELYIVGGKDAKNDILNTVICLNLKTMTLRQIPPMQESRGRCSAAVLHGFLYAVGGNNEKSELSSVEKFDPKTNKWEAVASMSVTRCNFGIAALNQKLYVVGGSGLGIGLSSAECYDPIQNVWQSIASMAEGRPLPGVAVANGLLYAVGGHKRNTLERYDPQTNKWSMMCSLSQGLHSFSGRCTTFRDKIVVCFDDHIEVYNSATNEWKKIVSLKSLNICSIFSYSDELLTTEFI